MSILENVDFAKFVSYCTALRDNGAQGKKLKKEWNRRNGNPMMSALKSMLHLQVAPLK